MRPLSFILIVLNPVFISNCLSQSNQNIPLFRETYLLYEKDLNMPGCTIHTSLKPWIDSKKFNSIHDSIRKNRNENPDPFFSSSLKPEKKKQNTISFAGIIDTQLGAESTDKAPVNSLAGGAGLIAKGHIKEKLTFSTAFIYSVYFPPSYIDYFIRITHVVPGRGMAYSLQNGYSNQYYSGNISYSPNEVFNFQIGKDKHFWGDGYRSLFLSDVSNSFPFLKITTTIWKIQYVSLFACMKDATIRSHLLNKYGTFHYLSWNATKRINIALFESVIWQGTDQNRVRNFDLNYLNPVIFFRPVEYSLGSSDNSFLGFSFKIKAAEKLQLYGQVILDEFLLSEILAAKGWWGNKQGAQVGFKSFDLFTLNNLTFQTEINAVRPYTYSHASVQQNYAHFNQPLAHPLGANFIESVSFLNYNHKKWSFEIEFLYAAYGKDEKGKDYGQNIFEPYTIRPSEYGNAFLQGLKTKLLYTKLKIAYHLIPSANIMAEAGLAIRRESNTVSHLSSNFIFIGIKTGIMNHYQDF
jgi:hypothetical protein